MTHPLIRIALLIVLAAIFLIWALVTCGVALDYLKIASDVWSARHRYRQTQGKILVAEVHSGRSRDQVRYWPYIRYEFTPGQTLPGAAADAAAPTAITGLRYRLARYSLRSDQALAQRIVAQYPAGSSHVVWYDPADPTDCALELAVPHFFWLYVLFLQPFIAAAIGLLLAVVAAVRGWRNKARCLARGFGSGWSIPGWGTLSVHAQGWQLGHHVPALRIAFTCLSLYAACCLIAFFILDGTSANHEETIIAHSGSMILLILGCFVASALFTYVVRNQLRVPLLRIDAQARELTYTTVGGTAIVALSDLRTWEVRTPVLAPRQALAIFELCLVRNDGTALTVHRVFHHDLAAHIAQQFNEHTKVSATSLQASDR